jgi:hypothetical protein
MLVASFRAARHVASNWLQESSLLQAPAIGMLSLLLLLLAALSAVWWFRRLSMEEYLATRDPVSGSGLYRFACRVGNHAAVG